MQNPFFFFFFTTQAPTAMQAWFLNQKYPNYNTIWHNTLWNRTYEIYFHIWIEERYRPPIYDYSPCEVPMDGIISCVSADFIIYVLLFNSLPYDLKSWRVNLATDCNYSYIPGMTLVLLNDFNRSNHSISFYIHTINWISRFRHIQKISSCSTNSKKTRTGTLNLNWFYLMNLISEYNNKSVFDDFFFGILYL